MSDASKPSRRKFLALTAGGATLVAATAGTAWLIGHRGELEKISPENEIPEPMSETGEQLAKLIQARLDMLVIPDATVAKWVNAYERHEKKPWSGKKVSRKDLQNFLLSTDLFPDGDEQKPLAFVAYYDPYISVCYNPLRHAD
jgi:hypothetical protein